MVWPPLNHALLIEAIGLTLLALLCTLCSTIITNCSPNPTQSALVTILPLFPARTTLPALFGSQRPPPAPKIFQPIHPIAMMSTWNALDKARQLREASH
jgi:hypothetical protein